MSEEGIIQFVSRLLEDEDFQNAFLIDSKNALEGSGLDLTKSEIDQLSKLDKNNKHLEITLEQKPTGFHLGISHKPNPENKK